LKSATCHPAEEVRIEVPHALNVLDTAAAAQFDAITKVAATLCHAPIALVSLVDRHRQWFKSVVGLPPDVTETSRDAAFCAHAILDQDVIKVKDASVDERFHDNPLVPGDPNIRFCAGQPLIVAGMPVGTLCVIDSVARKLSTSQRIALKLHGPSTRA
jgi:GAF domain-containing protein